MPAASPTAPALDLICLGEPLIEFNEQPGGGWAKHFGGDVSNVAIAAARQGARVGMAAALGADGFGDDLIGLWARERIDGSAVMRDADAPTGVYFVRHGPDGHSFEYRRAGSAASRMTPDTAPMAAIRAARALHVSGISQAISRDCEAAVRAAIAAAKAAGGVVSYDPNLRLKLWPLERARTVIHDAMSLVDIALPGLDDARLLTGRRDPAEIARFYLDLGPSIVALTLGEDGALIATRDGFWRAPSRVAKAVDATGAGDCFDGAFLAHWLASGDPLAAARQAVAAASLSVEGYGAVAPIPLKAAVDAVLDQTPAVEPFTPRAATASAGDQPAAAPTPAAPSASLTLALVAHDKLKPVMADWVARHETTLGAHRIIATGTTAGVLKDAAPSLSIAAVRSGPLGGDQQIGGMIADGAIDALIFFPDPMTPMPHDVDVKALLRIALVTDTPCAFSRASADLLMRSGFFGSGGGAERR